MVKADLIWKFAVREHCYQLREGMKGLEKFVAHAYSSCIRTSVSPSNVPAV